MVSGLYLVPDSVSEGPLCKIMRAPVLAAPISEAGSEAVRGCNPPRGVAMDLQPAEKRSEGHVGKFDLIPNRREHEGFVQVLLLFEDCHHPWREGNTMG